MNIENSDKIGSGLSQNEMHEKESEDNSQLIEKNIKNDDLINLDNDDVFSYNKNNSN